MTVVDASPEIKPHRPAGPAMPEGPDCVLGGRRDAGRLTSLNAFIFLNVAGATSAMPVMVTVQDGAGPGGERPLWGTVFHGCPEGRGRADGDGETCARFRGMKKADTCCCRRQAGGGDRRGRLRPDSRFAEGAVDELEASPKPQIRREFCV